MNITFILDELPEESLDAVLSLPPAGKSAYFKKLMDLFYPNLAEGSDEYTDTIETYISSFYIEKLYRTNRFFNEKYIPIYTKTGLIRNIVADMYFISDDLITH
jgi:hypothetical protein